MPPHPTYSPNSPISSVWDYVLARFRLCRTRDIAESVGCDRDICKNSNHMDPSPCDHNWSTCVNPDLSEIDLPLTWRRVDASGASDVH